MLTTHQGKVTLYVEVDTISSETVRDLVLLDIPIFNKGVRMFLSGKKDLEYIHSPYFVCLPLESEVAQIVEMDMHLTCYHVKQTIFHYYILNNGLRRFQTIKSCAHRKRWVWEY